MKDKLFELIRNEKVIIFAGAGTSMSSGYPSGNGLKEILYNSMNSTERENLEIKLPLPDFVEKYCRIKNDGRKSLNRILINEFVHKVPKSISWHKKLSRISHFKTIITTNYDSLFEKGYGENCRVIFKSSHLTNIANQTEVFKIHGCISDVENIIITNSDYNNFFKSNLELSIFWSTVKSRMAMNSILFLGYSLEDPNVKIIFEKICEELGREREDVFFMSPNLADYNIEHLKHLDIKYINMTANTFLNQLTKNIEDNVVSDFNNKKITSNTLIKYSEYHGLFPNITMQNGSNVVNSFVGTVKQINPVLTINFTDGEDFNKTMSNFIKQKNFERITFSNDTILNAKLSYGKLNIPTANLSKIEFVPQPHIDTVIDLKFDDGFEFDNIYVKLYSKENFARIETTLKNSSCIIECDFSDENIGKEFSVNYNHNEKCGKVKDEIEEFNLLRKIGLGENFTTYEKGKEPFKHETFKNDYFLNYAEPYLQYFEKLRMIENHYTLRFTDFSFDSISETESLVNYIISVINNEHFERKWNGSYKFKLTEENKKLFFGEDKRQPIFPYSKAEIVNLHGNEINLGYPLTQLKNIEYSSGDDDDDGNPTITCKSKDGILFVKYFKQKMF